MLPTLEDIFREDAKEEAKARHNITRELRKHGGTTVYQIWKHRHSGEYFLVRGFRKDGWGEPALVVTGVCGPLLGSNGTTDYGALRELKQHTNSWNKWCFLSDYATLLQFHRFRDDYFKGINLDLIV